MYAYDSCQGSPVSGAGIRGSEAVPRDRTTRCSRLVGQQVQDQPTGRTGNQSSESFIIHDSIYRSVSLLVEQAVESGAVEAEKQVVNGRRSAISIRQPLNPHLIAHKTHRITVQLLISRSCRYLL